MKILTFDIETYANYILFALRDVETKELFTFEIRGAEETLSKKQIKKLHKILTTNKIITYNGLKFDEPVTAYALKGATATEIFQAGQTLIKDKIGVWTFYRQSKCKAFITNHIDIMDVARGSASLKLYGSRLHTKKLQDLPYEPHTILSNKKMDKVLAYCENDNIVTNELYDYLDTDLQLRASMSKQYGLDFMSFKGAKIAELILVKECGYQGGTPERPSTIKYKPPKYIKFKDPQLKALFKKIKKHTYLTMGKDVLDMMKKLKSEDAHTFLLDDLSIQKSTKKRHGSKSKKTLSDSGSVISPDFLDAPIVFDGLEYKFGIGGLHASVESTAIIPEKGEKIVDIDYKSLYPSLIIENNFVPRHIGKKYLKVYGGMYHTRNNVLKPAMKKHAEGSKKYVELDRQQDTMKLVLNSSFGQTGQRFSKIYDPSAMLHTTLTGQLTLMMVVEMLSRKGFQTFYANTDGITLKVDKKDVKKIQKITRAFDEITGLEMEYNFFSASYIRDVNNFINITDTFDVKSKGTYGKPDIEKNIQTPIVFTAIRKFLQDKTPVRKTIKKCKDVRQFLSARVVKGGAVWMSDAPDTNPDGWEESLTRNKRITKKMQDLKDKGTGLWTREHGRYLGKVVRWYYSKDGSPIYYKESGNKVPKSDGASPMMDLPKKNKIPKDLDYEWYYDEAQKMLEDLGYGK